MAKIERASGLNDYVRRQVAAGFESGDAIEDRTIILFGADPDLAHDVVAEALRARTSAAAGWPAVTDCDRLDRAFAALDASGVVTRQHFSCCHPCGNTDMFDAVRDERERGRAIDGYVFYSRQDTAVVVDSGVLRLNYAGMAGSTDATTAIGNRIVKALRAQGLTAAWDGDAAHAIELPSFDWKRRRLPIAEPTWTVASVAERWSQELSRTASAELSDMLGNEYGAAAVATGAVDVALAWACARLPASFYGYTRSRALLSVALALRGSDVPASCSTDLWLEAYATTPAGCSDVLIDLLVAGGELRDDAVRARVRDHVLHAGSDMWGAAVAAWYLVRAPAGSYQDDPPSILRRVERKLDAPNQCRDEPTAHAALAAALWLLHARRGEVDQAHSARDVLLEAITPYTTARARFLTCAAIAVATEVGETAVVVPRVPPWMSVELADAFVRAGQIDSALEVAKQDSTREALLFARLARRRPDDPRAAAWIARAVVAEAKLSTHYEDGLITDAEVRDARVELAALHGERGNRDRARLELAAVTAELRSKHTAIGSDVRKQIEAVAAGLCAPALPIDGRVVTPEQVLRLEASLDAWESEGATRAPHSYRSRRGASILEAAIGFARRGELDGARELVRRIVEANDADAIFLHSRGSELLIAAWVAIGELDRALAHERAAAVLAPGAIAPIAARLAELGRLREAVALVGSALDRVTERADVLALVPAVLAVSDDPQVCAAAMLDAWRVAESGLNALH